VIDNPDRTVCAAFALIAIAAAAAGATPPAGIVVRDVSPEARSQTGDGRSPAGKMMAIVADPVDPRNVYAASQWAGVWRSTDAGRSWAQASRFLATGSTSSRARHALAIVDPYSPDHVYITDGNTGGSIRSSAEGGASWKQEIELEKVASRGGEFVRSHSVGRHGRCDPLGVDRIAHDLRAEPSHLAAGVDREADERGAAL
jgi:opacity protein-like surface antigen